ncbi:Uncharacterised protein [Mycobacterium tuberculosis]|nr:hypothetical protein [Mycobacterium tuberculosis]CKS17759.1 Uncharacterised protein [Mycobacterium tuberculosis]
MGIGDPVPPMMIAVFWLNIGGSTGGEVGLKSPAVASCTSALVLVASALTNAFVAAANLWVNSL